MLMALGIHRTKIWGLEGTWPSFLHSLSEDRWEDPWGSTFVPQLIITASASLPTLNLLLWAVVANPEGLLFLFGFELS